MASGRAANAALAVMGAGALWLAWRRFRQQPPLPRTAQLWVWRLRQRMLRRWLVEHDMLELSSIGLIGGVDISFIKGSETDACAALVVLDATTMKVVYESCQRIMLTAPYIPGYLAFREW